MSLPNFDPITLSMLGVVGILAAFAELLLGRIRRVRMAPLSLILAGVFSLLGGMACALEQPAWIWQPLLAVAGVELLLATIRAPWMGKVAGSAILQSSLVLVGSASLLGWQLHGMDQGLAADLERTECDMAEASEPAELSGPPSVMGQTDAGRSIPLFTVSLDTPAISAAREEQFLRGVGLTHKLIQTAPPDMTTNCHGWVFTGGRHWLRTQFVEAILEDNGYRETTTPTAGDVGIFRNAAGAVTHSSLVRGSANGVILLESKWGRMGRYIHTAEEHGYRSDTVTYYRSSRQGHLLSGL